MADIVRVQQRDVDLAKSADPTEYLRSRGYTVTRQGRHLSARCGDQEYFRITLKPDGHYVACGNREEGIGDNIALARFIEGISFQQALSRFIGYVHTSGAGRRQSPAAPPDRPKIPWQRPAAKNAGRAYLIRRGISEDAVCFAEHCGALRYLPDGVLFLGLDEAGQVRSATKRFIEGDEKRDLKGSDKSFPMILAGGASVVIVEGGVDVLAAHTLALRRSRPQPTAIATGGAKVDRWMSGDRIRRLLSEASSICIALENEKNERVQAETDAAHERRAEVLKQLTTCPIRFWRPPAGIKDLAVYNQVISREISHG